MTIYILVSRRQRRLAVLRDFSVSTLQTRLAILNQIAIKFERGFCLISLNRNCKIDSEKLYTGKTLSSTFGIQPVLVLTFILSFKTRSLADLRGDSQFLFAGLCA